MVVAIEVMADKEAWLTASPDLFALWRHTGMSVGVPLTYCEDSIGQLETSLVLAIAEECG